ncbi:uroporphyrinogen decarboxylase family protein [Alkalibacter mobilis]|uniref:uroporphyrinogen decarboxylase family protein n=1 Tax=Alkalibacter mobilis TaxID=2787712 RepID=UPI00189F8012|nr:uroporphyrinogen decarboxylase family protein [Alkalibacter mobilis]MBF7097771.1 hypothetical protein [Alkalibacter mobilis]
MSRPVFSPTEFEVTGMYPGVQTDMFEIYGLPSLPEYPKLNRPISAKENWKLLFEGAKPYWIPSGGWMFCDINVFRPRINPDNVACHIVFDGEDMYPYQSNKMKSSWFDLEWEYVKDAGGATVHPGNPKVKDISKWEDYVSMPNLDELDWESCKNNNVNFLDVDKANQLGILSGLWERLMAVMDVENAAIAMIDEDEIDGVKRFFDQYTNVLIDYIRRMKDILPIDAVLIHDDWGHQQSTFFSLDTYREMLVPYYKRIIDAVHELGMWFELHSCGKNQTLVPAYIEMGVDLWCPQDMNDIDTLFETYNNDMIAFGIPEPAINPDASEEEIRAIAAEWVEKFKDYKVVQNFKATPPSFTAYIYEFSRKAYQNV